MVEGQNQEQDEPPTPKGSAEETNHLGEVTLADNRILLTINLVLQTAFLKPQRKPISLLLLGKPGIGKSRILSPLSRINFVEYVTDITPTYLVEFLKKVESGEKKFLAIPDFTNCTAHSKSTRATLTAYLRNMTEEGVSNISAYRLEFKSKSPVRAGLITAVTTSSFKEFKTAWKNTGFLSRLLPFSFSHSVETQSTIRDSIDRKQTSSTEKVRLKLVRNPPEISCPPPLMRQLRAYEDNLSALTDSAPYRHQIQLNAITEALAVIKGEREITQDHIDKIIQLSAWMNYNFKEL